MDLWSDECLKKAQSVANDHHLNRFVELPQQETLQIQRAFGSHVSKMYCSAPPCDETDRVCSFQEAAAVPPPPMKYFHCVYFHAEEVPLPPSPPPADAVLDMGDTHEKKRYPDLKNIRFPSLDDDDDDEVSCLTPQPLSVMACEVPLPPSPAPADVACHVRQFHEEYPYLMPLSLLAEVPLPPSPPPPEDVPHMGDNDETRYPDLKNIGFPSLDDDSDPKRPHLLPHEVPLPPSPPPGDDALYTENTDEKKYPDLKNIRFPSLDDDTDVKHHNLSPSRASKFTVCRGRASHTYCRRHS